MVKSASRNSATIGASTTSSRAGPIRRNVGGWSGEDSGIGLSITAKSASNTTLKGETSLLFFAFSARVNSSLFDEADRIAPGILGIEGAFAPGDCDATAGIIMHLVAG